MFSPASSLDESENTYKSVKILPNTTPHETTDAREEQKILNAVGKSSEPIIFFRDPETKKRQAAIVMNYEKGKDCNVLMELRNTSDTAESKWPGIVWLNIGIKSVEAVIELLKKGVMHLDLKPPNMMYDFVENKLSLIDLGIALQFKKTEELSAVSVESKFSALEGTIAYLAPEFYDYSHRRTYTEKSLVFTLGRLLQEILFNQDVQIEYKDDNENRVLREVNVEFTNLNGKGNFLDLYLAIKERMSSLVSAMQEVEIDARPTLREALLELEEIRKAYLALKPDDLEIEMQMRAQAVSAEKTRYEAIISGLKKQSLFPAVSTTQEAIGTQVLCNEPKNGSPSLQSS